MFAVVEGEEPSVPAGSPTGALGQDNEVLVVDRHCRDDRLAPTHQVVTGTGVEAAADYLAANEAMQAEVAGMWLWVEMTLGRKRSTRRPV